VESKDLGYRSKENSRHGQAFWNWELAIYRVLSSKAYEQLGVATVNFMHAQNYRDLTAGKAANVSCG